MIESEVEFSKVYEIGVTITFKKPDGTSETGQE